MKEGKFYLSNKIPGFLKSANEAKPQSNELINENKLIPVHSSSEYDNDFDNYQFTQFFQSPLPGILNQFDRCSMAYGVECRMPFMDYRLVEYVFSLPAESKVGGGYTKRILRDAVKDYVPDEIRLNTNKIGFNAPMPEWFKTDLKEWLTDQINSRDFMTNDYFDGKLIKNQYNYFLQKKKVTWDDVWRIWPSINFHWWLHNL